MVNAKSSLPVTKSEIKKVSMVPIVRHEIDFTTLLYDFSLMLILLKSKKKLFWIPEELKYILVKIHLYTNYLL